MTNENTCFIIFLSKVIHSYNKERRIILQPLLTNVKEYGIEDITKVIPIGEQQATMKRNRYRVAEEDLKTFMVEKGFTNLNL